MSEVVRNLLKMLVGRGANDALASEFRDATRDYRQESHELSARLLQLRQGSENPLRDLLERVSRERRAS